FPAGWVLPSRALVGSGGPASGSGGAALPPPVKLTAKEDHKQMMDLLKITSLRPGANGNNRQAPNAANYDESKANPYPNLPDPLTLKNGKKVTTAACGGTSGVRKSW